MKKSFTSTVSAKGHHVVVIGAGLAGSIVADKFLRAGANVTVVVEDTPASVHDTHIPARLWPHIGNGTGGTTRFWHNGLIPIPSQMATRWPFPLADLKPYQQEAYAILGNLSEAEVQESAAALRKAHLRKGIPAELLGEALIYPRQRYNLWQHLQLDGTARVIRGRCLPLEKNKSGTVTEVTVQTATGPQTLKAEKIIVAAGGLGTPYVLEKLSPLAGCFYEDHITAFIGEIELTHSIGKLWNYVHRCGGPICRQPFVVKGKHGLVAFYLRPAFHLKGPGKRQRIVSAMSDLRNRPFRWKTYWTLLRCTDDVADILSFKLGLRLDTNRYAVLAVAEQPPSKGRAITYKNGTIIRSWQLPADYFASVEKAFTTLTGKLGKILASAHILPEWTQTFTSSSHHSGTARMGTSATTSVCDKNGKVWNTTNVYVADGSVIPASGYANTGLAIGSLALRLSQHVLATPWPKPEPDPWQNTTQVDVVVSGAGGYIGQRLIPLLCKKGLTVVDSLTFSAHPSMNARWFVHLANIHGNPTANATLTAETLHQYHRRVQGWVIPMTFSTLHGSGKLDEESLNAGKRPWLLSPYAAGKLLQEKILTAFATRHQQPILLPYLPHIDNPLSPWRLWQQQVRTHGIFVGGQWKSGAAPSLLSLEDLADWLSSKLNETPAPGITRSVLRNPKRDTTWNKAFGEKNLRAWYWPTPLHKVIFGVRKAIEIALALAWRMGLLGVACHVLWRARHVPVSARQYDIPSSPARLEPLDPAFTQPPMGKLS